MVEIIVLSTYLTVT